MKKIALIVLSAVILFAAPSCKKQKCKLVKHVLSEEYVYAEPCSDNVEVKAKGTKADKPAKVKKAKVQKLWRCEAKKKVKDVLKASEIINTPRVVPVAVGYYECNCAAARELLYKAQVNGLVDVAYTDIKDKYSIPTYWVEVALTSKGKALIVEDKTPIYPEDTIKTWGLISPDSGKNKYGEYTYDYINVPADVVELLHNFYRVYLNNKNAAIYDFGTPDLVLAQERILKAKELGVRKQVVDPFTRNHIIKEEHFETLKVCKWTYYVDLYIVEVNGQKYCVVVKDQDGVKKIDDVALDDPTMLKTLNTMRHYALDITAKELHDAQKLADVKPSRPQRLDPVAPSVANVPATPLLFDEYMPVVMPGIEMVVRTGLLPYELAKLAENQEVFNLFAFDKKLVKMGKLKDVKGAVVPTKKATIALKTVKVSPLGRISYDAVNGTVEEYTAFFQLVEDEWLCTAIHEKEGVKVVINDPIIIPLHNTQETYVIPAVTEELDEETIRVKN
jgi:hypothetical protein